MAIEESTAPAEAHSANKVHPALKRYAPVPGAPDVLLEARVDRGTGGAPTVRARYIALPEALVRIGLVTAEAFVRPVTRGKPRGSWCARDTRGNPFWRDRWPVMRGGAYVMKWSLHYHGLTLDRALELPGVREALAANETERVRKSPPRPEGDETFEEYVARVERLAARAARRVSLRIVVDNTREPGR